MAINPMMFPAFMGMGGQQPQQPQPQQQPPQPQTPDSLAEFTRLLSGDLSGSLASGDKLMALSGLLRSATRSGRRAGLTPDQVMGELQQRKIAEVQNRLAVEQMRAAEAQRQQQRALINEFAGALDDPQQVRALQALGPEEASKKMAEVAFRPRQVQEIKTDDQGNARVIFSDGTTGTLDFKLERGAKWIKADPNNTGREVLLLVDDKTGKPIRDPETNELQEMALGSSWAEQQRIAQGWANVEISRANLAQRQKEGGRERQGKRHAPAVIYNQAGKQVLAEFDPNLRQYFVPNTDTVVKRGVGPAKYD
jgi:hypothetical protein